MSLPVPTPVPSPVLVAATTVLDTLPHVRRFVEGNLAGGLDHLVVFLDRPRAAGQAEVAAYLDGHPHVTCVRAGTGWWGERRPSGLNERQCTNANVVKQLLAGTGVDWVFHVDGDEVARVDRGLLAALPADATAVQLAPREAVAQESWDGEPTLFKRALDDDDLVLLHTLGVLAEPTNRAYFHGHLQGKPGVRPEASGWLNLHRVVDAERVAFEPVRDPRLELFHYESYSGEEFVRKWTAMVASGPRASYRPGRADTARALHALIRKGLPEETVRAHLVEIFRRTTLDDARTLASLGLLLDTDPLAGEHRPVPLPAAARSALDDGLARLRGAPKGDFFRGVTAAGGHASRGGAGPAVRRGVRRLLRGRS